MLYKRHLLNQTDELKDFLFAFGIYVFVRLKLLHLSPQPVLSGSSESPGVKLWSLNENVPKEVVFVMYGVLHAADIRVDDVFKQVNYAMSAARTTLWNSENREHLKNFRNADCVVTNHNNVQDTRANLKTTN